MAATRSDIHGWLVRAIRTGATHLIVVCDTFDHEDYPVYVTRGQDVRLVHREYDNVNMQRVVEVYSLARDLGEQLNEKRAMHFD